MQREDSIVSSAGVIDHEAQYGDDDYLCYADHSHSGPHWVWLTAGSCNLGGTSASSPPNPPPNWFVENSASHSSQLSLCGDPWRVDILQSLRHNNDTVLNDKKFKDYEAPIERTSWVRTHNKTYTSLSYFCIAMSFVLPCT